MLWRDLQITANMIGDQFLDVFRRFHSEVIAQTRGNKYFLHAVYVARFPIELNQRHLICLQVRADTRVDAGRSPAGLLRFCVLAAQAPHIGGWTTEVRNNPCKRR